MYMLESDASCFTTHILTCLSTNKGRYQLVAWILTSNNWTKLPESYTIQGISYVTAVKKVCLGPGEGEGVLGLMFAGYVPLAFQSPYPIIVYFLASYRPHSRHFLENVIFAIPIYASALSGMWFQTTECNAVNTSLLLNSTNNNFLIF